MGYSCAAIARIVEEKLINQLKAHSGSEIKSSNTWKHKEYYYFAETGREQSDGAITGSVHKMCDFNSTEGNCIKVGTYRIEPNGRVSRFPTASKIDKKSAWSCGISEFNKTFGSHMANNYLQEFIEFYKSNS